MKMRNKATGFTLGLAVVLSSYVPTALADLSYSTSFENFALGRISPTSTSGQHGWSGGESGGLINNNTGDEQIINTQSHSGSQSWHYARGYGSPGEGTPFTPNLSSALDEVDETFSGSLWFKAAIAGDGSSLAIEGGNLAGNDRSEILAYIHNNSIANGGLSVTILNYEPGFEPVQLTIASGLDYSAWHELTFSLTRTATGNLLTVGIDDGPSFIVDGYLAEWRNRGGHGYTETSRLKFRDRGSDNSAHNGFYIDDVSYSVPEPTAATLVGLGMLLVAGHRRLRRR